MPLYTGILTSLGDIAPQAIATRVRNYLSSRALRRTAATMFQTVPAYRWEFDLDTLLVP